MPNAVSDNANGVTVVSGLPRSGTSMAMAMLEAGGMPLLCDGVRAADADNPGGYFEYEAAKRLRKDASWLGDACGRAVKVISYLLDALPPGFSYRVVFMERPLDEVLASQRRMLERRGKAAGDEAPLRKTLEKHLVHIAAWLGAQPHFTVCRLDYAWVVDHPEDAAQRIEAFLGGALGIDAMAAAVDTTLHQK